MMRKETPDVMGDVLAPAGGGTTTVALEFIDDNPFQERSEYGDLTELANDIREHGLLQPPVVRRVGDRYELAFGHRRKRACELAGMMAIPVVIRKLTDEEMATIAFSENEQRLDITAIDKAVAIQTMITRFGWSQQQVADRLSVSRPTVSNLLRLLKLPEEVQTAVVAGEISTRQAEAMIPLLTLPAEAVARLPEWGNTKTLLKEAKGGRSSDALRNLAAQGIERVTKALPEHWNNYDFGELAGIEAATCTGCAKTLKLGDQVRCQIPACWDRKSSAWLAIESAKIVAATGVPMLPEGTKWDERTELELYDHNLALIGLQPYPARPAQPCDNLRVRRQELSNGKVLCEYVCHHPGAKGCKCLQKAAQAARKDGTTAWRAISEATEAALAERLAQMEIDALRLLAWTQGDWKSREQVGTYTAAECVAPVTAELIKRFAPYEAAQNIPAARAAMEGLLRLAGVTLMPWSLAGQVEAGEGEAAIPVL